ncbi:uncharacterized protein LOC130642791 [Hydractinia symbiolongicarpus]|uniref:uncharacterized protein LOC130642791 n=1 Tax=Hydractinia symbiolongicarpus TaxID=13093 RepID=UPI002551494A|nr:uncharacterized protein LOC130642791 [Hydractinia symbiolongicarpus]
MTAIIWLLIIIPFCAAELCDLKADGMYQDPHNCNGFIECLNYETTEWNCPRPDLFFDPVLQTCTNFKFPGCEEEQEVRHALYYKSVDGNIKCIRNVSSTVVKSHPLGCCSINEKVRHHKGDILYWYKGKASENCFKIQTGYFAFIPTLLGDCTNMLADVCVNDQANKFEIVSKCRQGFSRLNSVTCMRQVALWNKDHCLLKPVEKKRENCCNLNLKWYMRMNRIYNQNGLCWSIAGDTSQILLQRAKDDKKCHRFTGNSEHFLTSFNDPYYRCFTNDSQTTLKSCGSQSVKVYACEDAFDVQTKPTLRIKPQEFVFLYKQADNTSNCVIRNLQSFEISSPFSLQCCYGNSKMKVFSNGNVINRQEYLHVTPESLLKFSQIHQTAFRILDDGILRVVNFANWYNFRYNKYKKTIHVESFNASSQINLMTLQCPLTVNLTQTGSWYVFGSSSYIYVKEPLTFDQAEKYCAIFSSTLTSITNYLEHVAINQIVTSLEFWIGLVKRSKGWEWLNGENVSSEYIPKYASHICGAGNSSTLMLHSDDCMKMKSFICKRAINDSQTNICGRSWIPHLSGCFALFKHNKSWTEGRNFCQLAGGRLAVPNTECEKNFIDAIAKKYKRKYWIGLSRKGNSSVFTSEDSSKVYKLDPTLDLNFTTSEQQYVYIDSSRNYEWKISVFSSSETYYSLCEKHLNATNSKRNNISETPQPDKEHKYWIAYQNNSYLFVNENVTWFQAERICRDLSSNLTSVLTADEEDFLVNVLSKHTPIWLGYVKGMSSWTDGKIFEQNFWATTNTSDAGKIFLIKTKCGMVYERNENKNAFVCKRIRENYLLGDKKTCSTWSHNLGYCYYMSEIHTTKTMAKYLCIAGGGSLLDVENECEKQFVSSNTFWVKASADSVDLKRKFVCRKPAAKTAILGSENSTEETGGHYKLDNGWFVYQNSQYFFARLALNKSASQQLCEALGGALPSITTISMLNFVLNASGSESIFWTDLANSTKHQHSLWVLGIPDYGNDQDIMATRCGLTSSTNIKTNAQVCQRGNKPEYITHCVPPSLTYNSSCYTLIPLDMTWQHAELVCNNIKASVLTLPTRHEWHYLLGNFKETTVTGSWLASSSEQRNKSNLCLYLDAFGKTGNISCQLNMKFICKKKMHSILGATLEPTTTRSTGPGISIKTQLPSDVGQWSTWSPWLPCDVLCGSGNQIQTRECLNNQGRKIDPELCTGKARKEKNCLGFGDCSKFYSAGVSQSCADVCESLGKICDKRVQTGDTNELFRATGYQCSNNISRVLWTGGFQPYIDINTYLCVGYMKLPNEINCEVKPSKPDFRRICKCINQDDVGMTTWTPWSKCSSTCGGTCFRRRTCALSFDGPCSANRKEVKKCGHSDCPVHGEWTAWAAWTRCNQTCGHGVQSRNRSCSNPFPSLGGEKCFGEEKQYQACYVTCTVNGSWSTWTAWSACNKPCGHGNYVRTRTCTNPLPLYGGCICKGVSKEETPCGTATCPKVTVQVSCKLDRKYTFDLTHGKIPFAKLEDEIRHEIMSDNTIGNVEKVTLLKASPGSIDVVFSIEFTKLNNFELLSLQDSIDVNHAIGKIPIVPNTIASFKADKVPTSPPSNITIRTSSPNSLTILWKDVNIRGLEITSYILFYREKSKVSSMYDTLSTNQTSAVLSGLKAGTRYVVRILASTKSGNGIASKEMVVQTEEDVPSLTPGNVTGISISFDKIFIQWKRVDEGAMNGVLIGYDIILDESMNRKKIFFPHENTSVILDKLKGDTQYVISVCAVTKAGSGPCGVTQVRTKTSAPTESPMNLTVVRYLHNSLSIQWRPIPAYALNGELIGYKVLYKPMDTHEKATRYLRLDVAPWQTYAKLNILLPNSKYMIHVLGINAYGDGIGASVTAKTCKCPEVIYSNYYITKPYTTRLRMFFDGIFPTVIRDMFTFACGFCPDANQNTTTVDLTSNGKYEYASKSTLERVVEDIDDFTQLSFPLSASVKAKDSMDMVYVPILKYPGSLFIIRQYDIHEHVMHVVVQILQLWPLFVINFMLIVFVGAAIWLLDVTGSGKNHFSLNKWDGIREGWYYAYVTQTTIGYGDFTPKRFLSRCFAIGWMFLSIIMSSVLLVGALTTAFTTSALEEVHTIYGRKIAALSGSFEEKLATLRNGKINKNKTYSTVSSLVNSLVNHEVDGILLDAYTSGSYKSFLKQAGVQETSLVEFPRTYGVVLSGGLARVNEEVRDYVASNEDKILKVLEMYTTKLNPKEAKPIKSLFDPHSEFLKRSLVILSCLLFLFLMFGCFIWFCFLRKRGSNFKIEPEEPNELENLKTSTNHFIKDFYTSFTNKVRQVYQRHELERIKLRFDRGASSLRNINTFSPNKRYKTKTKTSDRNVSTNGKIELKLDEIKYTAC